LVKRIGAMESAGAEMFHWLVSVPKKGDSLLLQLPPNKCIRVYDLTTLHKKHVKTN
jgi:hypothetical protein